MTETDTNEDLRAKEGQHDDLGVSDDDAQKETQELENLYNSSGGGSNGSQKTRNKSGGNRNKIIAGGALLAMLAGVALLMFLTTFRVENVRSLLWDYRFARFHGQVAKRINENMLAGGGLTDPNPSTEKVNKFKQTKLYKKFEKFTPQKAMDSISRGNIKIDTGKVGAAGFKREVITSFTDASGNKTYLDIKNGPVIPDGATRLPSDQFAKQLKAVVSTELKNAGHSRNFQKQTRKLVKTKVRVNFGDRYATYKDKLKAIVGDDISKATPEEEARARKDADIDIALGGETPRKGGLVDPSEAVEDILDGVSEPAPEDIGKEIGAITNNTEGRVKTKFRSATNAYTNTSLIVMGATYGCILKDVTSQFDEALDTRINAPMRLAASVFGEAEQLKTGDVDDISLVAERNKQLSNFEQSAAAQRISGKDNISELSDLQGIDLPFTFFGKELGQIASHVANFDTLLTVLLTGPVLQVLPGGDKVADEIVKTGCGVVLSPYAQNTLAAVDVALLIGSIGTAAGVEVGIKATIQTAIKASTKAVTSVTTGYAGSVVMFEYIIPKLVFSLAGSGGIMNIGDIQNGNKLDLGTTLLSSQITQMAGGVEIPTVQASRDNTIAFSEAQQQRIHESGYFAYIDPASPYSLSGMVALSLPSNPSEIPSAVARMGLRFGASIFSGEIFSNLFTNKAMAAATNFETYGVPQFGIPDSLIDVDPIENALAVDGEVGQLDNLMEMYEPCFSSTLAERGIGEYSGEGFDFSVCSDQNAQRLGLYIIDNCAAVQVSGTATSNDCSLLSGAGDLE